MALTSHIAGLVTPPAAYTAKLNSVTLHMQPEFFIKYKEIYPFSSPVLLITFATSVKLFILAQIGVYDNKADTFT